MLALPSMVAAQQSVVPPDQFTGLAPLPAVNAYGMPLAQNDAAIDQARLLRDATPPTNTGVNAYGTALPETEPTASEDDSFGAQMILKQQERVRSFVITGGASLAYTSNVALTRRGERHDVFAVVDAGIGWSKRLTNELETSIGAHVSIFRYNRTPDLDFENIGFSAGLGWTPRSMGGISFFGRYDFTELLDRGGGEILMEHALTVGVQKTIALGRSHGFSLGFSATAALSDPDAAQRQQIGAFISYHLQLTRKLETAVLFRPAVHFYSDSDRTDFNQIISWTLRYRITSWADVVASVSHGFNRSDRSVFDYDVLTSGAAVALSIRF
ncbi:MAG TPA: hypothetical protein VF551_01555 [Chthoniobacterales bacterium]